MKFRAIRVLEYDFEIVDPDPDHALAAATLEAEDVPESEWTVVHTDLEVLA